MRYETAAILLAFFGWATAAPLKALNAREVPQEHSHEQFLITVHTFLLMNNPDQIIDPVFGLLGNTAAAGGQGKITDTDCLQQATADQAFTNAKAYGSVDGQVAALIYRTLERNTGKVGLASAACTSIKATNPEIAALCQHQDPASPGAAAQNKAVVLELAKQISAVGGDPQLAINSGTFAPGNLNDDTGAGNTCDTLLDAAGCIFTFKLLIPDATADEIVAAVAGGPPPQSSGINTSTGTTTAPNGDGTGVTTPATTIAATTTATATSASSTSSAAPGGLGLGSCSDTTILFENGLNGRNEPAFVAQNQNDFNHGSALNISAIASFICQRLGSPCNANAEAIVACNAGQATAQVLTGQAAADAFNAALAGATSGNGGSTSGGTNVQKFTGTLGGAAPPVIFTPGLARPFEVNGSTDVNKPAAIQRSCDIQKNSCADDANDGQLAGGVGQCDTQHASCLIASP